MNLHVHTLILLPFCFLCSFCHPLQAQTLNGIVTDAETGLPMEAVMISILNKGVMTDYTLTDVQGKYSLLWNYSDIRQVKISMLGYKQEIRNLSAPGRQNFSLQPQSIVLKEVEIRPGRIYGRKDTIRYDLSQFASSKDVHIKDVLKKLPGVEVEENGEVKYKGKSIDHFLVEGMDVTGGRYNQVNNNLSAKAVKTAEIMENYQSVKALKGKINSDEVALNLKLDPKARDQWIVNGTLGTGWSDKTKATSSSEEAPKGTSGEILWKGSVSALQLGKGKQSLYNYKTNNNGTDLSTEQTRFTGNKDHRILSASPSSPNRASVPPLTGNACSSTRPIPSTETACSNRMMDEASACKPDTLMTKSGKNGKTPCSTISRTILCASMKLMNTACRAMPPMRKCITKTIAGNII